MSDLLSILSNGYDSDHFPVNRNPFSIKEQALAIGYILKANQKPLPHSVSTRNSIWYINDDSRVVISPPKANIARIVYINGNSKPIVLTE